MPFFQVSSSFHTRFFSEESSSVGLQGDSSFIMIVFSWTPYCWFSFNFLIQGKEDLCVPIICQHPRYKAVLWLYSLSSWVQVKSFQHWGRRTGRFRSSEHSSQYPRSGGCFSGVPPWTTAGGHSLMLISTSLIILAVPGPLVLNLFQLEPHLTETLSQNQSFSNFYDYLVLKENTESFIQFLNNYELLSPHFIGRLGLWIGRWKPTLVMTKQHRSSKERSSVILRVTYYLSQMVGIKEALLYFLFSHWAGFLYFVRRIIRVNFFYMLTLIYLLGFDSGVDVRVIVLFCFL